MEYYLSTCIAIILSCIIFSVITLNKTTYYFIFEHKEWKLWRYFIKHANDFKLDYIYKDIYWFIIPNTEIKTIVWKDNLCSVFSNNKCILSTFYIKYSKKLAKLLLKYGKEI